MHLEGGLVADHHERVAQPLELRLDPVAVERLPLDHEDGAVAIAGRLEMDGLDAGRRLGGGRGRQRLARDRSGQPAEELDEPRAARVDHTRLAQDLELLGRAGHGFLPVSHELDEQVGERLGVGLVALRLFRKLADDREHRPLDRPPHGAVGGVGRPAQRLGRQRRADAVRRLGEDVGDAPHDLGEDHPGVAARSHQRGPRDRVREGRPVARLRRVDRVRDRPHRQREVRAGVAVGDGIDVEVVDAAAARLERGEGRADEPTDELEIAFRAHFPPVRTSSTCTSTARTLSPVRRRTS